MGHPERILIIDNERTEATTIKDILDGEGYDVTAVSNGRSALQCFEKESFDLVLMNVLPESIHDLDVIEKIRETLTEFIAVIVTGYASLDSALEAMRKGAYDYLVKPYPPHQLKMAVRRGLDKKLLETELKRKTFELERANTQLAERMEQLSVIYDIFDNFQKFTKLDDLLFQILHGIKDSLGFERVLIRFVNKNERILEVKSAVGVPEDELEKLKSQKVPLNEIGNLFKEKYRISRSYYIRYSEHDETTAHYGRPSNDLTAGDEGTEWYFGDALYTPLMSERKELIGIISVGNPTDGRIPSSATIQTFETFANTASAAIDRARLEEKLAAIYNVSRDATLALDHNQIYSAVLETATKVLHFDNIAIILIDEKTKMTSIVSHIGYPQEVESRRLQVHGDIGITVQAIRTGKPILVPDVRKNPHYLEGRPGTLSELAVPMKIKDKVIGVLNVESSMLNAFDNKDVALLEALASQAASSIEITNLMGEIDRTKRYLENLVDSTPDAIVSTDRRGVITFFSKGAERILGYSADEITGRNIFDYLVGGKEEAEKIGFQLRERNHIQNYETDVLAKDNSPIPISLSISSVCDENGNVIGTLGIGKNISERRIFEKEEKKLREQLAQAEKLSALGEFISGIAHELNNPLTGVLGFSQLLLVSDCAPQVKRDVEKIHKEATRCQKIVNNLLSFARRQKPQRTYLNVNVVIESALNLRAYQLHVDAVEVITKLDEHLPKTMADPHQLEQVFLNIITNAHQALLKVKEHRQLIIQTESSKETIRIKFSDTGPGIPPENLKRIFDPFFTTKGVGQGTGLGLSLSYGFVKEHEGSIYATSKYGEGATFVIEFPVVEESVTESRVADIQEVPSSFGANILVVDDEQVVLDLMFDILTGLGYRVDTAVSGHIALKLMNKTDYDLILTDVKMPGIDGRQLYNRIVASYPEQAKRILFITGYAISPDLRDFFDKTGIPHIEKPFDIDTLKRTIQKSLDNPHQEY
ncbi:MAG: response regulator [Gemmatimonadota bacterium]|nr:MAG: response regulator [Gemmatimonadota bacterium]